MTFMANITLTAFIATAIVCGIGYTLEILLMKFPAVRKLSEMLDWDEE